MSAFFRDLLTSAAVVGISILSGGTAAIAAASWGAFAARTANYQPV